ncbi:hypothetical protein AGMMS49579_23930 [Spirochaetia bacterium]|nr:hypothetical protein AGMMS49579_23930 [Spirochaetia bacterium]
MKLGIMQPYLFPYIGYWQLIKAVDTYVIYDDVSYIVRGWINRNNLLINGEKKLFTISLNGASPNKLINEISIADEFNNFLKMLEHNYSKAPYFEQVMKLIKEIVIYDKSNLALFIANSIKIILAYLYINTKLALSSSLDKDNSLKGRDKILDICKLLDASDYYNAIGGIELYSKEEFMQNNINLYFLKTDFISYKQFRNGFIPGLSIIDVMMFNSPEQINQMLDKYELILPQ